MISEAARQAVLRELDQALEEYQATRTDYLESRRLHDEAAAKVDATMKALRDALIPPAAASKRRPPR